MKIKFLENHQLPKNSGFIFSDCDIKKTFNNRNELTVWKSNHAYSFDKSYNYKEPKIKGHVIVTLSHSANDNVFFHLYGCKKEILNKVSNDEINNILIQKLQTWLEPISILNKVMPKHRMIIFEVDPNNGKLKLHELG